MSYQLGLLITALVLFSLGAFPLCYAYFLYWKRQRNMMKAGKQWDELQRRMDEKDSDHEDAQY